MPYHNVPYIAAPSNTPASSVASRRSLEPLKIYPEALAAPSKRRRNSGEFVGRHFYNNTSGKQ